MAAGTQWTQQELDITVAAYLDMLILELRGESYNKAQHWRALQPLLNNRTKTAIEMRHQNISSVLIALRIPYISGYKPLGNFPVALYHTVSAHIAGHPVFAAVVEQAIGQPHSPSDNPSETHTEQKLIRESPPERQPIPQIPAGMPHPRMIDFVKREAENHKLGQAGERLIFHAEQQRLIHARRDDLAKKVEWVSQSQGDGAGFDIRSFDEHTERERLIEVKTTTQGKHFPFYASRNEVQVSEHRAPDYQLQRLFTFRESPRLYILNGPLSETCQLIPTQYEARPG